MVARSKVHEPCLASVSFFWGQNLVCWKILGREGSLGKQGTFDHQPHIYLISRGYLNYSVANSGLAWGFPTKDENPI